MIRSRKKGSTLDKSIFIIIGIMIIAAFFRIVLGQIIGNQFYCSETMDDVLLMQYSHIKAHFLYPNLWSLVKTMGFPYYLAFISLIHLNYTFSLSFLWLLAALSIFDVIQRYFKNKYVSLMAYLYFLFLPIAFDSWMGTRIYRNAIIAPFVILFFSLLLMNIKEMISNEKKNRKQIIVLFLRTFLLGFIFTFTYYIKEDGLWLLACLTFFSIVAIIFVCYYAIKRKQWQQGIIYMIIICIPFVSFSYCTQRYKNLNEKYFGVSAIQTRTAGELGTFVNNVYKIDSDNQNWYIWAPEDSIEKVFKASPTLKKHPELLQAIEQTPWYQGDISKNPIQGDFLTWVLRSALNDTGMWKSEKQVDHFFARVNTEIDEAFNAGKLKKTNKVQLLSSAVGRNQGEITSLFPLVAHNIHNTLYLRGYIPGSVIGNTNINTEMASKAAKITRIEYLTDYSQRNQSSMDRANKIVSCIFVIYGFINPLLFVCMIIFLIFQLILLIFVKTKNKWQLYHIKCLLRNGLIILIFGICIAYSFSINWFSQFIFKNAINDQTMNFYTVALPPLLGFAYMISIGNFVEIWKGKK